MQEIKCKHLIGCYLPMIWLLTIGLPQTNGFSNLLGNLLDEPTEPLELCLEHDTMYNSGNSLAAEQMDTVEECYEWCQVHPECSHFSYSAGAKSCFLTNGQGRKSAREGTLSGPRVCTSLDLVGTKNINEANVLAKGGMESPLAVLSRSRRASKETAIKVGIAVLGVVAVAGIGLVGAKYFGLF